MLRVCRTRHQYRLMTLVVFVFFLLVCAPVSKSMLLPHNVIMNNQKMQLNVLQSAPSQPRRLRSSHVVSLLTAYTRFRIYLTRILNSETPSPMNVRRREPELTIYEFREAAHELFRGHKKYVVFSASTKINVFTTLGALNGSNHLINLLFMDGSGAARIARAHRLALCNFHPLSCTRATFSIGFLIGPAQYFGRFSPSKIYSIRIRWRYLFRNYLSALELA